MRNKSRLPVGRPPGRGNAVKHYKRIAASFIKKINSGSWPEGFQLPSHSQLAAQFKIGERTIRRALDCLSQEHRIVKTPNSQWKVQNSNLKHSIHSHGVLFITSAWLGAFWPDGGNMRIRKGIEINLARRIKQVRMYYKNDSCQQMKTEIIPGLADADIDGILLYGGFSKKCLQQYSTLKVPTVRVDAPVPAGVRLASISVDNVAATKDAVLRMYQFGHRRIAFCRAILLGISEIDPDSQARQEGFLAGLEDCGIKNGRASIYNFVAVSGRPNANVAAVDAILNARPRINLLPAITTFSCSKETKKAWTSLITIK
jgi:hypothetical protein